MKQFQIQQNILRILANGERYKAKKLIELLSMTRPTLYKYLNILVEDGKVVRHANGAHTNYQIAKESYIPLNLQVTKQYDHDFTYQETKILSENFLKYTPDGNVLEWAQGFMYRCDKRNADYRKMFHNFMKVYEVLEKLYTSCWVLDATKEFEKHVEFMAIDSLFYAGQYKRNEFGRSKLAEQGFYAKQTQNKPLLIEVCSSVVSRIECLVKEYDIDALAFTPPSIQRNEQILDVLDRLLSHSTLPRVRLIKNYPNSITTAQKSLRKRSDRIMNARNTIYVYDKNVSNYSRVLLIDDFVGSWSTLNETAKKLKAEWVGTVHGFALVGNLDLSYDVINEM